MAQYVSDQSMPPATLSRAKTHEAEYSPVNQSAPDCETPHSPSDTPTDFPESRNHSDPAVVHNSSLTYIQFLSFFLLILLLPLTIIAILSANDGIPAPRMIADFAISNPRLTPQLTTIMSSILTASVKCVLGGVITIRAQKHFQRSRHIYKIAVFSALKNGGIAWSWRRRRLMLLTIVVVALCELLTSGFVALMSPFPIKREAEIGSGVLAEVDFASPSPLCQQWHNNVSLIDSNLNDCPEPHRYPNSSFIYTVCRNVDPFGDFANAAKSSMVHRFVSQLPINRVSTITQSFAQLENTRFLGSTAGTLPIGPAGLNMFPNSSFPLDSTIASSYNYTLWQQAIWAQANCLYTNASRLVSQGQNPNITYKLKCAADDTTMHWTSRVDRKVLNGAMISGACYNKCEDNFTFHLRSFWKNGDDGASPSYVYAGIGAMSCSLAPRVGLVHSQYRASLGAFQVITPDSAFSPFTSMTNLTRDLVIEAMGSTVLAIDWGQTQRDGNMFATGVSSIAMMYGNLTGQQQDPIVLDLVADALKGIFEYKITNQRVIAAAHAGTHLGLDPSCFRGVSGRLSQGVIGWELKLATVLGLIPLLIISVACLGLTAWMMVRRDRLTIFNPTNPTSLIGAVANGKLRFPGEGGSAIIGDPEDEFVLTTKVRYEHRDGSWGLRRKED